MPADNGNLGAIANRACRELAAVLERVPASVLEALAEDLAGAGRVALYGVGREGLMMRALAMRLYHLGLDAHPVGDMTTPPLTSGDLLLASAGPGHFNTVEALLRVARNAGASTVLVTAQPASALAPIVDRLVVLPARTMAEDDGDNEAVLPMGSAYEGCQYLFFELLVRDLRTRLAVDESAMRSRHTNLE